jgi:trans-2,3-dihydro-3-hydroxyanthranilate isomerase
VTAHRYLHLDVFTERPFEGNQLAVFPDARAIPDEWMQPIAREMAFSETVFMRPPVTGNAQRQLRIFTPGRELPLAGHPTIGSAFVYAQEFARDTRPDAVTFDLGVGPIRVTLDWGARDLAFAWMHQPTPVFAEPLGDDATAALLAALHLPSGARVVAPPQIVSSGVPFLFVALGDTALVDAAQSDAARIADVFRGIGQPETGVFLFARADRPEFDATLYSRMFAPMFGIVEDPATGGASGPLGAYALTHGIVAAGEADRLVSLQGAHMGRPSYIHIGVTGRPGAVEGVRIGGTSTFIAEGTLRVPPGR